MTECTHTESQVVCYIKTNGAKVVVRQCQTCGNRVGTELPKKDFNIEALPDWDVNLQSSWENKCTEEFNRIQSERERAYQNKEGEWWEAYNVYLTSPEWRLVRQIVLNRDRQCQHCFENRATEAHHISYTTFTKYGFSFPQECVGVCFDCHALIHGGLHGPP